MNRHRDLHGKLQASQGYIMDSKTKGEEGEDRQTEQHCQADSK